MNVPMAYSVGSWVVANNVPPFMSMSNGCKSAIIIIKLSF